MKNNITLFLFTLLILTACKKEIFPGKKDLIGVWVEKTESSFKHKLIFEYEKLYFVKSTTTDTLNYWLEEDQERLYLSLPSTTGESHHKILLNKKKDELTIWNLFPNIPPNATVTVFKKE